MPVANQIFRVHYCFVDNAGIRRSEEFADDLQASSSDENTLKTILSGNGKSHGAHTLKILSVQNLFSSANILS